MTSTTETGALRDEALALIHQCSEERALEQLRVDYLGKKGRVTELLKGLGKLPAEQRPAAGEQINLVKRQISEAIDARREQLLEQALSARLAAESLDVTLPGRRQS